MAGTGVWLSFLDSKPADVSNQGAINRLYLSLILDKSVIKSGHFMLGGRE